MPGVCYGLAGLIAWSDTDAEGVRALAVALQHHVLLLACHDTRHLVVVVK